MRRAAIKRTLSPLCFSLCPGVAEPNLLGGPGQLHCSIVNYQTPEGAPKTALNTAPKPLYEALSYSVMFTQD